MHKSQMISLFLKKVIHFEQGLQWANAYQEQYIEITTSKLSEQVLKQLYSIEAAIELDHNSIAESNNLNHILELWPLEAYIHMDLSNQELLHVQ